MQAITHCSCVASTNDIARVRNTAMRKGTKQMTERGIEARCMRCQAVFRKNGPALKVAGHLALNEKVVEDPETRDRTRAGISILPSMTPSLV